MTFVLKYGCSCLVFILLAQLQGIYMHHILCLSIMPGFQMRSYVYGIICYKGTRGDNSGTYGTV